MRTLAVSKPDCAVVDLNLNDGFRFSVAATLRAGKVPIVFATGYDPAFLPAHLAKGATILRKPINPATLIATVARAAVRHEQMQQTPES